LKVRINVGGRSEGENKKLQILKEIYGFFDIEQSIIFVTTRDEATEVAGMFRNEKYSVSHLHSKLGPDARDEEFKKFREGKTKVLVTTNVLARGVNVPSVDVVVNYNLPTKPGINKSDIKVDPETYIHRMGRCGRFGRQGTAINLLETDQDEQWLLSIEKYYNFLDKRMTVEWDPNDIERLADHVRERSLTAVDPVHLETTVDVNDNHS
jgi:ATP-dependent RNA helicase DDX19/DBP5